MSTYEFQLIPLDQISAGDNPRTSLDPEELAGLTASIKQLGVLQPISVEVNPEGGFLIVAGERRWRAAEAAGLTEIPAMVGDFGKQRDVSAVAENVARSDLNPMEEAYAFNSLVKGSKIKPAKLAPMVGRSLRYVNERLALLELPAGAQGALAAGTLPMRCVPSLLAVAKINPAVAEALTEYAGIDPEHANELAERPFSSLCDLNKELANRREDYQPVFVVPMTWQWGNDARPFIDEALMERITEAEEYGHEVGPEDDDADAAVAFGGALRFKRHDNDPGTVICLDQVWFFDRIKMQLEQAEKDYAEEKAVDEAAKAKHEAEAKAESERRIAEWQAQEAERQARYEAERAAAEAAGIEPPPEPEPAPEPNLEPVPIAVHRDNYVSDYQQRAKEQAAEKREREAKIRRGVAGPAHHRNVAIGRTVLRHKAKLDTEMTKALCLLAIAGMPQGATHLWQFIDERFNEFSSRTVKKTGETEYTLKFQHDSWNVTPEVAKLVLNAGSGAEALRITLGLLALPYVVDQRATVDGQRVRGISSATPHAFPKELDEHIRAFALEHFNLPKTYDDNTPDPNALPAAVVDENAEPVYEEVRVLDPDDEPAEVEPAADDEPAEVDATDSSEELETTPA